MEAGATARHAPDRRQGAAGPAFARRRARRDRAVAARHRGADPRWHGTAAWATRSRRASRPAAPTRNCAAPASWRRSTPTCGSSRTWPRTRTRSAGPASCFPTRAATWPSTRLRPDARAVHLRALHPLRRRRPPPDAQHRRRGRRQPHQQPVPGQRLLRLRRRAAHRLSPRPGQRRRRRHQLQPVPHHAGGLLRGPRRARPSPASACRRRTCGGSTRRAPRRPWAWTAWSATCSPAARPTSWCSTRRRRRCSRARSTHARDLDELLFSLIVLGDDRVIERVHLARPRRGDDGQGAPLAATYNPRQERAA
jgi:hypothetical protein